jgi:hypothetical protein
LASDAALLPQRMQTKVLLQKMQIEIKSASKDAK